MRVGEQDQRPQARQRPALTGLVRGLFAGGTLALEAVQGLSPFLAPLYSNLTAPGVAKVPGTTPSRGHTILDLGADELTVGRLHPMLEPQLRLQRLRQEVADPEVSLVLLDVVLGRGTHSDPASELAPAIAECLQRDDLEVVVLLVGTEEDPQNLDSTQEQLVTAGATVYRTVSAAIDHIVPRAIPAVSPLACPVTLEIFEDPVVAINIGLEGFYTDLLDQQVEASSGRLAASRRWQRETHVDPGEDEIMTIDAANRAAVKRMMEARPVLIGVAAAKDVVPGMRERLLLHAGPPIRWDRMSGPLRGAIIGAVLFEGWASKEDQAVELLREARKSPLSPATTTRR